MTTIRPLDPVCKECAYPLGWCVGKDIGDNCPPNRKPPTTYASNIKREPFGLYGIKLAEIVATRSTCLHRHQGAVIFKDKHIISSGYNGSAPGQPNCNETYCLKDQTNGKFCRAESLHGENNAIISAAKLGVAINGCDMYCVFSPCRACCNMIKAAGIKRVFYKEIYSTDPCGPQYLTELGVICMRVSEAAFEIRFKETETTYD